MNKPPDNEATTDEINRYLATEVMGLLASCDECGRVRSVTLKICHNPCNQIGFKMPDYCSDSSPRSLLNEAVITAVKQGVDIEFDFFCKAEQIARELAEAHKGSKEQV